MFTHQVTHLPNCDHIIVMKQGGIQNDIEFSKYMDEFLVFNDQENEEIEDRKNENKIFLNFDDLKTNNTVLSNE